MRFEDFNPRMRAQMLAQLEPARPAPGVLQKGSQGRELEHEFQEEVVAYCRLHQFPFIRARMDVPSTIGAGVADITILLPGGKTLSVECKSKTGKQEPAQLAWQILLERVGHKYVVARTMEEVIAAVKEVLEKQEKPVVK